MTGLLLAAVVVACGTVPALAVGGLSPSTPFLIPLATALIAGTGAIGEFLAPGSFAVWFVAAALVLNGAAVAVLMGGRRGRRRSRRGWSGWDWLQLVVITAAVSWPLMVLTAPIIGYDTQAIWLLHAAMVYAGHPTLVRDLTNHLYFLTNPDYPPLAPASMAVGYLVGGGVDQHVAVVVVAALNASATGLTATGILRLVPEGLSPWRRAASLATAAALCDAVFGVGGQYALNGYADVLWTTAAASAAVFGVLLPVSRRNLGIAAFCLAVAAITKNEGMVMPLAIGLLMAWRVWNPVRGGRQAVRALLVAGGPFLPAAVWALAVRARHINDAFFASGSHETASYRLGVTIPAVWDHIYLLPVAAAVAVTGWLVLGPERRSLGAGPSRHLWIVFAWALFTLVGVYTFGSLSIHWWLSHSVGRTTMFMNVVMLIDMVAWSLAWLARGMSVPAGGHFAGRRDARAQRPSRSRPAAVMSSPAAVASATQSPQFHAAGS